VGTRGGSRTKKKSGRKAEGTFASPPTSEEERSPKKPCAQIREDYCEETTVPGIVVWEPGRERRRRAG